jgi:hypothetical protein
MYGDKTVENEINVLKVKLSCYFYFAFFIEFT